MTTCSFLKNGDSEYLSMLAVLTTQLHDPVESPGGIPDRIQVDKTVKGVEYVQQ